MKDWDVIVIGAGVIGLSLAWRLHTHGVRVLVVEKHEPFHEATYAAGGMIASCEPHIPLSLQPLVSASADMYPQFVQELEEESGASADLRDAGAIASFGPGEIPQCNSRQLTTADLSQLEPWLKLTGQAWYLPERSVDPRGLGRALEQASRRRSVDFVTGSPVVEVLTEKGRATGVKTTHSEYFANLVVNCCGAWAAQVPPLPIPTRPVKGQMLCLVPNVGAPNAGPPIQHVVRAPDIYVIPRSDGRVLLGATVEEAGFDKRVDPETIQKLYRAGITVAPPLANMRIHDAWAGLRPGSPDNLPILGETSLRGYFAATGHYRDGIMLAPITAHLMAQLVSGSRPSIDPTPFSPLRFE